jgi:hypothetical protein
VGDVDDAHRAAHVEDQGVAPAADAPAWITSWTASGMVMK